MLYKVLPLWGMIVLSCLGLSRTAHAHATLLQTTPTANAMLTEVPTAVQLRFSEPIERRFSRIEIYHARRDPATGAVQPAERIDEGWEPGPRLVRDCAIRLPAQLRPGLYLVQWAVLSVDSHRVSGSFSFSYAPTDHSPIPTDPGKSSPVR